MRFLRWAIHERYEAKTVREALFALFEHWHRPTLVAVFAGLSVAMWSIGQSAHSLWVVNLAFALAYVFLVIGLICAIGSWINSNFLRNKNPDQSPLANLTAEAYQRWKWNVSCGMAIVFLCAIAVTALVHKDKVSSLPKKQSFHVVGEQVNFSNLVPNQLIANVYIQNDGDDADIDVTFSSGIALPSQDEQVQADNVEKLRRSVLEKVM